MTHTMSGKNITQVTGINADHAAHLEECSGRTFSKRWFETGIFRIETYAL